METDRIYRLLGHLSFLILFAFASIWAAARVCYTDSAYQLFDLVQTGTFSVNDGRFSMVVSELLPLLCLKLHLPLGCVVTAYSLSFLLMACICYLLALYALKDKGSALLMLLFFIGMNATFIHCISETFQLLFAAALLYAMLSHRLQHRGNTCILLYDVCLLGLTAFCVFIHPVAVFFMAFIWLYVWVDEKFRLRRETVVVLLSAIACTAAKFLIPSKGAHDATFLLPLPELLAQLPNFLHFGSLHFFKAHLGNYYFLPVLIFIWTSVRYIRHRMGWKAFFYMGFNLFFFFITLWIYFAGDGPIGMERSFLPLFFFVGLPWVKEVLPALEEKSGKWVALVLACVVLLSVVRMGLSVCHQQKRLDDIDKVLVQARKDGARKVFVSRSDADAMGLEYSWGTAVESLIYTTLRYGKDGCSNLFIYEDLSLLQIYELGTTDRFAFVPWWIYLKMEDLNTDYFPLPEGPFYFMQGSPVKFIPANTEM